MFFGGGGFLVFLWVLGGRGVGGGHGRGDVVVVFWGLGGVFKSCLGRMLSLQSSIITPEVQCGTLSGFCLSGLLRV